MNYPFYTTAISPWEGKVIFLEGNIIPLSKVSRIEPEGEDKSRIVFMYSDTSLGINMSTSEIWDFIFKNENARKLKD